MTTTRQPYVPNVRPVPKQQRSSFLPWLIRLPLLGITALMLLAFILAIYLAVHQLKYDKLIYPGVSAYGVDLGGMSKEQAMQALSSRYTYGENAVFTFRDGDKFWQKTAKELGVSFDPTDTVEEAFKYGREGNIIRNLQSQSSAWLNGYAIQPMILFDQSKANSELAAIAGEINQPMQDATILISGTTVTTTPSQTGRDLDVSATVGLLRQVVLNMSTGAEINLIVRESKPAIREAETVASAVRSALSSPIQLYIDSENATLGPWEVGTEFIGGLMTIERIDNGDGTARYEIKTNTDPLKAVLDQLAPQLDVQPVSARFIFNDETNQLQPIKDSVDGRSLNVVATVEAFEKILFQPDARRIALVFEDKIPTVNSKASANELGITETIVTATTFFYGSTSERQTNIQVAASKFHGLVIAPGEEFSFNKYLGDVSPETGFETGLVIYGDRTIQGVGGGVCQVSTTIFQAAFFSGFPINERYAHGYRVGYYESGTVYANGQKYSTGVGLDATVYSPIIDLKFTNDSPHHILIETYYTPGDKSLTVKFYSTSTGRIVTKDGPTLSNEVPHGKPKYTESANIKRGQRQQIDYAVNGIDARVYRTITVNGQVITNREEFYSHYLPWSAQFLVAPGEAPRQ